jgi:hypothetical protein
MVCYAEKPQIFMVSMPRFYFHLCNGAEFVEDKEGVDLGGRGMAHQKAVDSLRDVMAGDLVAGHLNTGSFIEFEDEQLEYIETVSFADVVQLRDERHVRHSSPNHP